MKSELSSSILQLEGVSLITYDDVSLFEQYILKEKEVMYSNSWLYTLRSAVNDLGELGLKYHNNELLFTIIIKQGKLHIGKIFGLNSTNIMKVILFIERLYKISGLPILLRKVAKKDRDLFLHNKRFHLDIPKGWEEALSDECYPEKCIDLKNLIQVNQNEVKILSKRFRHGVNRFKNANIEIRTEDLLKSKFNLIDQLGLLRKVSRDNIFKYLSYKPILEHISKNPNLKNNYILRIYYSQTQIEGYYILEKLSEKTVGFYCGLTSIRVGGITEYLDYLIFRELALLGYQKVLLGGSEKIGIVKYVNKLFPLEPEYSVSPILYY